MQKRATIKDIAIQLGVSISTISRGLKDHPDISLEMRSTIKEKAKELNYHPNHLASGLRRRQSKFIGLIIPEITMFFFPSVIKGIEEVAKKNGYQLLVLQSNDSIENEKLNVQICLDHSVDGLLISMSNKSLDAEHLLVLKEAGIPVILFDKSIDDSPFDEVIIDDVEVAFNAAKYLLDCGCKRIVAALGSENLTMSKKRGQGVKMAIKNHGMNDDCCTFIYASNFNEGQIKMDEALSLHKPDGLFLMSDELIAASAKVLSRLYGNSSNKCKVIGFSDGVLPDIIDYPISYVHHSGFELGKLAANRLMKRLFLLHETVEEELPQRILLPATILHQ